MLSLRVGPSRRVDRVQCYLPSGLRGPEYDTDTLCYVPLRLVLVIPELCHARDTSNHQHAVEELR